MDYFAIIDFKSLLALPLLYLNNLSKCEEISGVECEMQCSWVLDNETLQITSTYSLLKYTPIYSHKSTVMYYLLNVNTTLAFILYT